MLIGFEAVYRGGEWLPAPVFEVREPPSGAMTLLPLPGRATPDVSVPMTLIPRLTDHHVHLGLTDPTELFRHGITHATDLGWKPESAEGWTTLVAPRVAVAGALLTCVGGYPTNAGWAPRGSTIEVADADAADAAVAAQKALGASVIKLTLNSDAGPVPDEPLLQALSAAAHVRGLPVVVHAQGAGQAARAFAAGVDVFAHAPFSERMPDELLNAMVARGTVWVSTLQIHGWGRPTPAFRLASDNVRRFAASGGIVTYGTDLGNGDLAVGVNGDELAALAAAGVDAVSAIARTDGPGQPAAESGGSTGAFVALVPGPPPSDTAELPRWLASAEGRAVASVVADAS